MNLHITQLLKNRTYNNYQINSFYSEVNVSSNLCLLNLDIFCVNIRWSRVNTVNTHTNFQLFRNNGLVIQRSLLMENF